MTEMVQTAIDSPLTSPPQAAIITLLYSILEELIAIRQATEQANEPGPDDEPSPFQSLSDT